MDFSVLLITLIFSLTCFALRAFARIGKPFLGEDTWAILLVADELKKGAGYNGITRHFLIGGDHDYPPLFFHFLSLFPSSWLKKYNWAINPALDGLNAGILLLVSYLLTGNLVLGATAAVVYSFTPVVLAESLSLNTRIFGMILFNCTLVSFVLFQSQGNSMFALFAVIGGILILMSHKFATELLVLLLLCFAVLSASYLPVILLFVIVSGAVIFSRGFYLKILRGHLGIIRFWLRHEKDYGRDYLNRDGSGTSGQRKYRGGKVTGSRSFMRELWRKTKRANPFYWLLSLNPFNPFALVVVLLPFLGVREGWEWATLQWSILTLLFFYAATYLRFLGHYPGRAQFLDYNAFPTALLCAIFVWEPFSYWKLLILILAFALSLIQNLRTWTRTRGYNRAEDQFLLEDIFDYLRRSNKDDVICLPVLSHTYAIPYFTGKKVFHTVSARDYEKLGPYYPVLKVPVKTVLQEYGISFILVDKRIVPVEALDLPGFKQVMEKNDYLLLERFA